MTERAAPVTGELPTGTGALARLRAVSMARVESLTLALLVVVIALGAYLRLAHNNWDADVSGQSLHLHPDERFITTVLLDIRAPDSIGDYFDTERSPLNPYNRNHDTYVYGELPLFLGKFVASNTRLLTLGFADRDWDTYDLAHRAGRALTGIIDSATILMVFLTASRLLDRRAGIVAATLYAFAPLPIQHSHFFVVDPYATFFAAVAVYCAIRLAQGGGWGSALLAGLALGFGTASKVTVVSLLPVVLLGASLRAWPVLRPWLEAMWRSQQGAGLDWASARKPLLGALGLCVVATIGAFAAFRVAMPYAFNAPSWQDILFWTIRLNPHWLRDELDQRALLDGSSFPPNVQWIGRVPWLWPLQQMVLWGMGVPLGVTAWLAVGYLACRVAARRELVWLVPLSWVVGYFAFMGGQFSLYMRYFLPLYPTLAALAAVLLVHLWDWSRRFSGAAPRAERGRLPLAGRLTHIGATIAGAAVVALTAAWGLAYFSIYTEPVTRVQASQWIHGNIPAGSTLGVEHWDDSLPFAGPNQYRHIEFQNYDIDDPDKVRRLLDNLDAVDYVILTSNRLSGSIPRAPAIWPVTTRYYEALRSGELGFEKAAEFVNPPAIFGVSIQDRSAEESWTVYDHPPVTIYRKTSAYSRERAATVLGVEKAETAVRMTPKEAGKNALQLRPDELEKQRTGGTWTAIFDAKSFANQHPLIVWFAVVELLGFAMLPLAAALFRALPDRGYLLTKPLGFVIFAYLVWGPVSFRLVDFTRPVVYGVFIAILVFGVVTRSVWGPQVRELVRERWRSLALAEALFIAAFLAAYGVRLANPDLWHPFRGGEKPMELAYLNAVTRSTTMPPYDPWYAGGYINYYYYGQFMTANVIKLTGILPEIAFNLALPTYFAFTVGVVASVAYNLVELARRALKRSPGFRPIPAWSSLWAAGLAVFLVVLAGNFRGMAQGLDRLSEASPWQSNVPVVGPVVEVVGGTLELLRGENISYDYWDPSRAIHLTPDQANQAAPITEFPMFTFMFADLHAHLMVIPVSLLSLAVGLAAVASAREAQGWPRGRRLAIEWTFVGLLGLLVGTARWTNSWDYPTFGLLASATLLIAQWRADGGLRPSTLGMWLLKSAAVLAVSLALFSPASRHFLAPATGFHRAEQTTQLDDYLWHFGLFVLLAAATLGVWLYRSLGRTPAMASLRSGTGVSLSMGALLIALPAVFVFAATQRDRMGVVALAVVMLAVVAWLAAREVARPKPDSHVRLFVLAMFGMAFALGGGVDLITLNDDITRMNTVFKFYLHAWLLFGLASAVGVWYLTAVMRPDVRALRAARAAGSSLGALRPYVAPAFASAFAVTLVGVALYPFLALPQRIDERFADLPRSINGMNYMAHAVFNDFDDMGTIDLSKDYEGILWMREHVEGSPAIMEGVTPGYRWGSRYSIYTGLPAVAGWDWHQRQQRGKYGILVTKRQEDVTRFYTSPDLAEQIAILDRYDVRYVIVGELERNYFPGPGLENIAAGLNGRLDKAFDNGSTAIYRVRPKPIPGPPLARAP